MSLGQTETLINEQVGALYLTPPWEVHVDHKPEPAELTTGGQL